MIKAEWTNADALDLQPTCNQLATDLISKQSAIDALTHKWDGMVTSVFDVLKELPSVQLERLTDNEQRIFLAAMGKEEMVCKKVDDENPEGINLVKVCKEIERKVKGALWT